MADNRFPSPGTDARFTGVDARFPSPGTDARFTGGQDTRFEGASYGGGGGGGSGIGSMAVGSTFEVA